MKKIFLYSMMLGMSALGFTSCNDDEDQLTDSRVTYFAELELEGDDFIVLNVGDNYVEPGFTATEGGEDITSKVVVSGTPDTSKGGFYNINYSVANKDNFAVSVTRTVMVVNPNSLASAYFAETPYYDGAPILITDNGNGTYIIDDVMGGYYFYYRYASYEENFGYDFHLEALVTLNDDNTLTQIGAGSWYFSSKPGLVNGAYDPETGTVTWQTTNGLSVRLTK